MCNIFLTLNHNVERGYKNVPWMEAVEVGTEETWKATETSLQTS